VHLFRPAANSPYSFSVPLSFNSPYPLTTHLPPLWYQMAFLSKLSALLIIVQQYLITILTINIIWRCRLTNQ